MCIPVNLVCGIFTTNESPFSSSVLFAPKLVPGRKFVGTQRWWRKERSKKDESKRAIFHLWLVYTVTTNFGSGWYKPRVRVLIRLWRQQRTTLPHKHRERECMTSVLLHRFCPFPGWKLLCMNLPVVLNEIGVRTRQQITILTYVIIRTVRTLA